MLLSASVELFSIPLTPVSDQLRTNYNLQQYSLDVKLEDLSTYNEVLANDLIAHPHDYLIYVRLLALHCALLLDGAVV